MKTKNFESGLALIGALVILIGVSAAANTALDGDIGGGLQRYSNSKSFKTPTGFGKPNLSPPLNLASTLTFHHATPVN